MDDYWRCVESIVHARHPGSDVVKYRFFEDVWSLLEEGVDLMVLEAPTGCGKTEAVSTPFLSQLSQGSPLWSSLILSLPTRSLAYSMRERLSASFKALGARWTTVTIDHGDLCFMKPYLEGDAVVTTYDTLLYTFYGLRRFGHHILLPVGKVGSSLIVMDEVQLLQDGFWYSMALLPAHVHALLSLGAQVVVMTATMPPPLREELLNRDKMPKEVRAEHVKSEDKPLRGDINVELREGALPTDAASLKEVLDEVVKEPSLPVLVVLNKVAKAVEVFKTLRELQRTGVLPDDVAVHLLHSRLRRGARKHVEEALEREGRRGSRLILVSTQVVEAGLDYDFRTLITEISPVDSLIQRVGRIARRTCVRGRAIIYTDLKASENVYPSRVMEKTIEVVRGHEAELSKAPSDVGISSELVGEVYTKDVVEGLQEEVRRDIWRIREMIRGFPETLILRVRPGVMGENLVRLGFEIKCWLTERDNEARILKGEPVKVTLEEFRQNIVSLSALEAENKQPDIPGAILHEINGKLYVVRLEVEKAEEDKGVMVIRGEVGKPKPKDFFSAIQRRNGELLFLLNRSYYESFDGEELGVVKPWK